jgi:hypothetical protein
MSIFRYQDQRTGAELELVLAYQSSHCGLAANTLAYPWPLPTSPCLLSRASRQCIWMGTSSPVSLYIYLCHNADKCLALFDH